MGEVVIILASFLIGALAATATITLLSLHYAKKNLTKRKEAAQTFLEELNKLASALEAGKSSDSSNTVDERLAKVKNIIKEQIDLQSKIEQPQRNSLDGKYKNMLIGTVKKLEEDKKEILRSILRDGFDPEVTVMGPSGESELMKLSEFMVKAGFSIDEVEQTTKPSKFTVHKGGKGDGDGETVH